MSIRAMNWAWSQSLRPVLKLILLALADAADHAGVCWPSIPTIARLTAVSVRTVQRALEYFQSIGLIVVEPRFRKDGSRTSNRYRLPIDDGGDKLSPPRETSSATPCHPTSPARGTSVTVTTSEPSRTQPPQIDAQPPSNPVSASGAGGCCLIYPETLLPAELDACRRQVVHIDSEAAQQLLDELSGRLRAGGIRTSAVSYLRSLVTRFQQGEFQPELALDVAEKRKTRQEAEARLRAARQGICSPRPSDTGASQADPEVARDRLNAMQELISGKRPKALKVTEDGDAQSANWFC